MAVYFLAYRGKSFLSRVIRFATGGDYSHIGLAVRRDVQGYDASVDLLGRLHVREMGDLYLWTPKDSERPRRDLSAWGHWPWDAYVHDYAIDREHAPETQVDIFKLPCTEQEAEKILHFFLDNYGARYDLWGAITSIVRPTEQDKKRWFCSESMFAALLNAEKILLRDTQPAEVSPRLFLKSRLLKHVGDFVLP